MDKLIKAAFMMSILLVVSCKQDDLPDITQDTSALEVFFGTNINHRLNDYNLNEIPRYIQNDVVGEIDNDLAILGRVLFYDKNLSVNNSVSCASCHKQSLAFGDDIVLSEGANGLTGRHSMRLINNRFSRERNFFWDERAASLHEQTTMPIQDHNEMGFSGANGDPSINDLIVKLNELDYYDLLFSIAFGDNNINEERMQDALAEFIHSIVSLDSKYDAGRARVGNDNQNFPNFTDMENRGKRLYMQNPQFQNNSGFRIGGGLACNTCHRAPLFDIDPESLNNGVVFNPLDGSRDLTVTRSPSLRDLFNTEGIENGQMMHNGAFNMDQVLAHYDGNIQDNDNLDRRLRREGGIQLNMTIEEKEAVIAFMKTLSGNNIYESDLHDDPFLNN